MFAGLTVAVVMPALNEEGVIGSTLASLPAELVDRVWVADNGSSDGTAREATRHGATVVNERRRGYGAACLAALRAMEHSDPPDLVTFIDADGSQPAHELPLLLEPIASGAAELVVGIRRFRDTPLHVALGNRAACMILQSLTRHKFSDLGPFRALRFETLRRLGLDDRDFGWNVQMQARAVAMGARVAEVHVSHRPRLAGRSKISGSLRGTALAGSKILWVAVREGWRARVLIRSHS